MNIALTLAALLLAAPGRAAETWDPKVQYKKYSDWFAVGFEAGGKHQKLFFHKVPAADRTSKPEYAPVGPNKDAFQFSYPLVTMKTAAGKPLPEGRKTPNHFAAEETPYRLNMSKEGGYAVACAGTCSDQPDAKAAVVVRGLNAMDGIVGLDNKGTPNKLVPSLYVEPPTGAPVTAVDAQPTADADPLKAKLSDWEKKTAGALGVDLTKCGDDAGCRAALKATVASQISKAFDATQFAKDESYAVASLGGKDSEGGKKFLAAEAWAKEQGPAALKAFQDRWHAAVAGELTAYNDAKAPGAYDPSAVKSGVAAALAAEPEVPTTELGKAIAKVYANETPAMRKVMEQLWSGSPESTAIITGLAAKPDAAKRIEMRGEAKQAMVAFVKNGDPASALAKAGAKRDDILAAYCPGVGGGAAAGPSGPKAMDQVKAVNAGVRGQAASGSVADGGKAYDGGGNGAGADPLAKECSEFNAKQALADFKNKPASQGSLTAGNGTHEPPPVTSNDKGDGKGQKGGKEIGSGAAPTDDKPEDANMKTHVMAGVSTGLWAAVMGGIFLGPVGLLLGGAVGLAAGFLIDKVGNPGKPGGGS